jgi:hypothetical protein
MLRFAYCQALLVSKYFMTVGNVGEVDRDRRTCNFLRLLCSECVLHRMNHCLEKHNAYWVT